MRIDTFASKKIALISFFAMCAVVSWHVSDTGGMLKRWLCPIISVWSVPWFFFVSGVFFAQSIHTKTVRNFIASKLHSLLVPYVLWCSLGFALLNLMGSGLPFDICGIFALDRLHPIGDSPMWYIRALIIIFTLSIPVWCLSAKLMRNGFWQRSVFAFALCLLFIAIQKVIGIDLHLGPGSSLYYFLIGVVSSASIVKFPMLPSLSNCTRIWVGVIALVFAMVIRGVWFGMGYDYYKMGGTLVANVSVVLFIFSLLVLADSVRLIDCLWRILGRFTKYSSFVYMIHWIFLGYIIAFGRKMGYHPDVIYISYSLLMPFLFIGVGALLRYYVPKVYFALTGNRG